MLDTVHVVETPEGVTLDLRAAGVVPRALAFLLDFSVRAGFYFAVLVAASIWLGNVASALFMLVFFVVEWFYPVAFEVLGQGQTLGKRALGLRVVQADGTPVRLASSLLRNLLLAADWMPGTCLVALVSMLVSPDFRRLGDLAAGTLVIHVASEARGQAAAPDVPPLPTPLPLSLDEQRAVIAFGARAPYLSEARADELASIAVPLHGAGEHPRRRVLRVARYLLGGDTPNGDSSPVARDGSAPGPDDHAGGAAA